MDYGSASKARLVAQIINKRTPPQGKSAFAVWRDGIYTVIFAVMPPNDIC